MKKNSLFYRYYDQLFLNKPYAHEIHIVGEINQKLGNTQVDSVLEVGCGTGNHTIELAKIYKKITAIDIDSNILELARQKIKTAGYSNVAIKNTPIYQLHGEYDLAVALFNVVNYLLTFEALELFFISIYKRLTKGGLFIADCWNGVAVLVDPPKVKKTTSIYNGKKIVCKISPHTNIWQQKTIMEYSLKVGNKEEKTRISHLLWTPLELHSVLSRIGFFKITFTKAFQPNVIARESDWKIMIIAKK